jgi:hypothetical protein
MIYQGHYPSLDDRWIDGRGNAPNKVMANWIEISASLWEVCEQ